MYCLYDIINGIVLYSVYLSFFISIFQYNFIAVSCGVNATSAANRKSLIHRITSSGWREDRSVWHCTSQCASSIDEASSKVWKTTMSGMYVSVEIYIWNRGDKSVWQCCCNCVSVVVVNDGKLNCQVFFNSKMWK